MITLPKLPWGKILVAGAVVVLLGLWLQQRATARRNAFLADSLAAAADTLRVTHAGELDIYRLRAIQSGLRADSLDRALKQRPVFRDTVTVYLDTLIVRDSTPVTADPEDRVRVATLDRYEQPFTLSATVRVPRPPDLALWDTRIALDPIPLEASVTCGEKPPGGVRPVEVRVVGPSWARIGLSRPVVDPDACNATAGIVGPTFGVPWWVPVLAGAGGLFAGAVVF